MFKSVFAKYISAFMMIFLLSFLIIILIISSIITSYSEDAKTDIMNTAARSSATYITSKLKSDGITDLEDLLVADGDDVKTMFSVVSSNSDDITLLVADRSGEILLAVGDAVGEIEVGRESIPREFMDIVNAGNDISDNRQMEGIFDSSRFIHAVPIYNQSQSICGTVFVCASSLMINELLDVIIKTIVVAILWVLLASLVAVYIISDKVTSPLREISTAAKSYAAGRFDVRVPVRGEDEVAELAIAFNNMAESLNNYDNMRNTFMSNVSHDLRTPMTSISGFIDGILDGVIPPEKHEYYLQIVSSEVKRLSRLVSTLLDLSRIQAGDRKFTMTPFDICEMGREILISFEQKINDKKLDVEFDIDDERLMVSADRDAIYQIFYNLCDNAVKFAKDGGKFKISIKKNKNKKILVSVFNDGQGISGEDLPYVFERFYKSDKSRGLNKTGVGLGLFISKTIIEAHNEKIWVESEFGENCCFNFTLPIE